MAYKPKFHHKGFKTSLIIGINGLRKNKLENKFNKQPLELLLKLYRNTGRKKQTGPLQLRLRNTDVRQGRLYNFQLRRTRG